MLKILIVDDEVLVKIGLRNAIDWAANGYEIVGEASNGLQALEMARERRPDIVLTDVRMPKMTGLELIEALNAEQPNVKFIILSAYGEFDYAQQAVRMGVVDYILKLSMEPEGLLEVLARVRDQIGCMKSLESERAIFQEEQRRSEGDRHGHAIRRALDGDEQAMVALHTLMQEAPFAVGIVRLPAPRVDLPSETARQIEQAFDGARTFSIDERHYGVLMPANGQGHAAQTARYELYIKRISQMLGAPCIMGMSAKLECVQSLNTALKEASDALKQLFYCQGTVLSAGAPPSNRSEYADMLWQEFEGLLEDNQFDLVQVALLSYLDALPNAANHDPQSLCEMVRCGLQRYAEKLNPDAGEVELPQKATAHISSLRDWAVAFFAQCHQQKIEYYGEDIMSALEFIDSNYTHDLRLSDLAALLYKNESYISHLFKKRMGLSFVDYITLVRIQKAKEMLTGTMLSIGIIAERVGFNDVAYFCRVFKKNTALSPQQYRLFACGGKENAGTANA